VQGELILTVHPLSDLLAYDADIAGAILEPDHIFQRTRQFPDQSAEKQVAIQFQLGILDHGQDGSGSGDHITSEEHSRTDQSKRASDQLTYSESCI
jgi:hypothetical protein